MQPTAVDELQPAQIERYGSLRSDHRVERAAYLLDRCQVKLAGDLDDRRGAAMPDVAAERFGTKAHGLLVIGSDDGAILPFSLLSGSTSLGAGAHAEGSLVLRGDGESGQP